METAEYICAQQEANRAKIIDQILTKIQDEINGVIYCTNQKFVSYDFIDPISSDKDPFFKTVVGELVTKGYGVYAFFNVAFLEETETQVEALNYIRVYWDPDKQGVYKKFYI